MMKLRQILPLVLTLSPGAAMAEGSGDALARKFLDHMAGVAPVAGRFRVAVAFDPEVEAQRRADMTEWGKANAMNIEFGPESPTLVCEWGWDGSDEALRTLDGSNVFRDFYRTPEALLRGMAPKNYNLTRPDRVPEWRPGSFYLLAGDIPWGEFLAGCEFVREDAPAGSPAGSARLVARSSGRETRLVLDEASGRLLGHEIDLGGEPYSRLQIDRFASSPGGRVFPAEARLTISLRGRPHQFVTLTADRVVFEAAEARELMGLVLPKGTLVHDRVLGRVLPIRADTPAELVLAGEIEPHPLPDPEVAALLPAPAETTVTLPSGERGPRWPAVAGALVLVAVGVWALVRGGRLWDRGRQDGAR